MATSTTYKQGDTYYSSDTGKPVGTVEYSAKTGQKLAPGATTTQQNQLIVTGTRPAQQFAQNQQQLTQALNRTAPPTQPPPGWDATTYANFKKANPTLEPNAEDTAQMRGEGGASADGSKIESPYAGMESYSDPYTQQLDKIAATSDKATQNLIATIKAHKANQMRTINDETDRLKQGLMSLGLSTGNINFTPDLVYGSIQQAENARATKLQKLDQDEATALLEAQQASENKEFDVLKEKMDHYKEIKKSRLDILKDSYDTMNTEAKIGDIQANQIYDQLQKLPSDKAKLDFMTGIATKAGIPLLALTTSVNDIKLARAKSAGKGTGSTTTSSISIDKLPFDFPDSVVVNGVVTSSPTLDKINEALANGHSIEEIGAALGYDHAMIQQLKQAMGIPVTKTTKKKTTTPTTTPAFKS